MLWVKPQAIQSRWRRVSLSWVLTILTLLGCAAVWFLHSSSARDSSEMRQAARDLARPMPWVQQFLLDRNAAAFRAGRASWVPRKLRNWAGDTAYKVQRGRADAQHFLIGAGSNAWPVVPTILKGLKSRSIYTSFPAAVVLIRIRADEAPDFPKWAESLRGRPEPIPALLEVLRGSPYLVQAVSENERHRALAWIQACRPSPKLVAAQMMSIVRSQDESHQTRAWAMRVLGSMSGSTAEVMGEVRKRLNDPNEWPDVRGSAAWALAGLEPDPERARDALAPFLSDPAALARLGAIEGLHRAGAKPEVYLSALEQLLEHRLWSVRAEALRLAHALEVTDGPLRQKLLSMQTDSHAAVRHSATNVLTASP